MVIALQRELRLILVIGIYRLSYSAGFTYQLTSNPNRVNYFYNEMDNTLGWTLSQSRNDGGYSEVETFAGAALPSAFGGGNTNSTGVVRSFSDANASTVEDQAGKKRRSITNALGHLIRVDEPNDAGELGTIASPNQPTSYTYDTLNNLLSVVQGSQTRTFVYSSLSRMISEESPEAGTNLYEFDNNGNSTKKTDSRGVSTNLIYDALSRVTQKNYTGESGYTTPTITYTYDEHDNAIGRLTKVSSSISETKYTEFDKLGRVLKSRQTTDGNHYDFEYDYNLSGALIEQTYPSGRVVKNVLDNNGDLSIVQSRKDMSHGYMNYAQNFTYNAVGAATSMQLGNGKWESTQFNSRLQPTQIALGVTNGATNFLKLDYGYGGNNNNGNVVNQTITVPTVGITPGFTAVQNYTYDSLNRIKTAEETVASNQTWKQAFLYDRYGNRNFDEAETTTLHKGCTESSLPVVCAADRKVLNPTANLSDNRLSAADDYDFDAVGNTTSDPQGRTFIYDAENKQVEVKDSLNNTIGLYFYDGDGKRIKKIVPNTNEVTIFVYDVTAKLVAEYSTELSQDPKVNYTTSDHLGSPRILTDENGEMVSRRDFHPFGEEIASTDRTAALGYQSDDVRKKFTGYERDSETDLDFAQARMHDYNLGRFSSPDPLLMSASLENPQTWNRYTYVLNNPLSLVDRDGLYPSPAFNCTEANQACLNDEQRRILNDSKVKIGDEILSGEKLYERLGEKRQNAFVNLTDKLASLKTEDGATLLSKVESVSDFQNDRIIANVDKGMAKHLESSEQFSTVNASGHKPFNAVSYKNNDTTFGNIQISLNETRDGADIDIDIGNMKSGDVAGPVVHAFEVIYNQITGRKTNQNMVRRILMKDPSVQTITPSTNPKYNRKEKK